MKYWVRMAALAAALGTAGCAVTPLEGAADSAREAVKERVSVAPDWPPQLPASVGTPEIREPLTLPAALVFAFTRNPDISRQYALRREQSFELCNPEAAVKRGCMLSYREGPTVTYRIAEPRRATERIDFGVDPRTGRRIGPIHGVTIAIDLAAPRPVATGLDGRHDQRIVDQGVGQRRVA